jgi:hypothetical protein
LKNRIKVARQLLNYKKETYEFSGKVIPLEDYDVKELIEVHMTMDSKDFLVSVLKDMLKCEDGEVASIIFYTKATNYGKMFVQDLLTRPRCSACIANLALLPEKYATLCAEEFPKVAKMCDDAEFKFAYRRHKLTSGEWFKEFHFLALTSSFSNEVQRFRLMDWRKAFMAVEMAVYYRWTLMSCEHEQPDIIIPAEVSVHPDSQAVLAYTAGWIISRLIDPANIKASKIVYYATFAESISISQEEAELQNIPTALIKMRERKHLRRPSAAFYSFISHVETVFMENMNFDMMVAYSSGNILEEIKLAILQNPVLRSIFFDLFPAEAGFTDDIKEEIMKYAMQKFKRMRGKWFSKAMDGQIGKTYDKVAKAATRDGVAAKGLASKTAALKRENEGKMAGKPSENNKEGEMY